MRNKIAFWLDTFRISSKKRHFENLENYCENGLRRELRP